MYIGTHIFEYKKGKILLPEIWVFSNETIYVYSLEELSNEKKFPFLLCSPNNLGEPTYLGSLTVLNIFYNNITKKGENIIRLFLELPDALLNHLGGNDLEKTALLGCGNYFEIWNLGIYEIYRGIAFNNPDFSSLDLILKK